MRDFKIGDKVQMTEDAILMQLDGRGKRRTGMVVAFHPLAPALMKVRRDGLKRDEIYARSLWKHVESEDDILDDERVDKELRRWQDAIRDKMISMGVPDHLIDGAGCDSGDPLDFTLAEVGQGLGYFIDKLEARDGLDL